MKTIRLNITDSRTTDVDRTILYLIIFDDKEEEPTLFTSREIRKRRKEGRISTRHCFEVACKIIIKHPKNITRWFEFLQNVTQVALKRAVAEGIVRKEEGFIREEENIYGIYYEVVK